MDEEKIKTGHWLGLVLRVSAIPSHCQLGDSKDSRAYGELS